MTESTQAKTAVSLQGWWRFDEPGGQEVADLSGNGHTLAPTGGPSRVGGGKFGGAYALDGATQWLSTSGPVVATDTSLSIAAWVRMDSAIVGDTPALKPDYYAVTAVSQDGPAQCPVYLGARLIDNPLGSGTGYTLRWNFTASPAEDDETGVEWAHAYSQRVIDASELDQWVLLVGVYSPSTSAVRLYVPGNDDEGFKRLPPAWPTWRSEGAFQLGRGWFKGEVADQWPGSIGQVRIYTGELTREDAARLYAEDSLSA